MLLSTFEFDLHDKWFPISAPSTQAAPRKTVLSVCLLPAVGTSGGDELSFIELGG